MNTKFPIVGETYCSIYGGDYTVDDITYSHLNGVVVEISKDGKSYRISIDTFNSFYNKKIDKDNEECPSECSADEWNTIDIKVEDKRINNAIEKLKLAIDPSLHYEPEVGYRILRQICNEVLNILKEIK